MHRFINIFYIKKTFLSPFILFSYNGTVGAFQNNADNVDYLALLSNTLDQAQSLVGWLVG